MRPVKLKLACAALLAASAQADAQQTFANPPLLQAREVLTAKSSDPPPVTKQARAQPPAEVEFELDVMYTDGKIRNPAEGRYDAVRLRSYQGTGVDPAVPYTSPTIVVYPGQTIRITLNNKLPRDASCLSGHHGNVNDPHCFNGTNLHTHGLWVNPAGNGDNVLISINPGVGFQYEYKIPPDHPAGTFWYHSHRHGSTALQVSSGMAGALIVRGTRFPTATRTGDIDTLLEPTAAQSFTERVLVLQQIQYACRDAEGKVKTNDDGSYRCDPGDVGGIEGYDQIGFGTWPRSGRHTSINGRILPVFLGAKAGQIERWRMIHGGVRDTINLQFRKLNDAASASQATRLKSSQQDAFVSENCTGGTVPQYLIAADGLTLKAAIKSDVTVFQPAYRWDSLMVFPEGGVYCVIDEATSADANVGDQPSPRALLGLVVVEEGPGVDRDIGRYLARQLILAARANMPEAIWVKVASGLNEGLKLDNFVPHPDIAADEVTGTQELIFNVDSGVFQVDGHPYEPSRIDRVLMLGGVDEWTLRSHMFSHPFHIHVNPFQIVAILDPNGNDVSAPDALDLADGTQDPQYRALKGVWKDTLWVKSLGAGPTGTYKVVVRTRYRRYIGDFVLHCHILDHEDRGMMQNIRVALPDGDGGTTQGHH